MAERGCREPSELGLVAAASESSEESLLIPQLGAEHTGSVFVLGTFLCCQAAGGCMPARALCSQGPSPALAGVGCVGVSPRECYAALHSPAVGNLAGEPP